MNKPSKCKNCQWYGKPYWSIINPCDNCPMENVETITHWIDPTIQEKDKEIERLNNDIKILLKENDNKEKVIIKLNNIINELEKYLEDLIDNDCVSIEATEIYEDTLDKLKELKEGK